MIDLIAHEGGTILYATLEIPARPSGCHGLSSTRASQADAALQEVLADAIGCKASQVALLSGETSRTKRFLILGISPDELQRRLAGLLAPAKPRPQPSE